MNKQERDELREYVYLNSHLKTLNYTAIDHVTIPLSNVIELLDQLDELEDQLNKRVSPVPLEALEVFNENIHLQAKLDAYERVVEAAKLYKSSEIGRIFGTSKSRLFDEIEALEGLEDED